MPFCNSCERYFVHERALEQHLESSPRHNYCAICEEDFTTPSGLRQHYIQSSVHHYCKQCDEDFTDKENLSEHLEQEHDYCSICNRIFGSEQGLHDHRTQKHKDIYCIECKRIFRSENNLRTHLNSSLHQDRTLTCPMRGCAQKFLSPGGVTHHLESGGCRSGLKRQDVNKLAIAFDKKNVITDPARLLTYHDPLSMIIQQTIASALAWNGSAFKCYFCHHQFPEGSIP